MFLCIHLWIACPEFEMMQPQYHCCSSLAEWTENQGLIHIVIKIWMWLNLRHAEQGQCGADVRAKAFQSVTQQGAELLLSPLCLHCKAENSAEGFFLLSYREGRTKHRCQKQLSNYLSLSCSCLICLQQIQLIIRQGIKCGPLQR